MGDIRVEYFTILFSLTWGGLLALLGSVFLTISIFMKKHTKKKESNCTVKTMGKVIDIIERYDNRKGVSGGRSYYPVLEYYVNGNAVTQNSGVGSNPCRYVVGQSVEMQYNPNMPSEIMLEGNHLLRKISSVFSIVAYILFGLGIAGIILVLLATRSLV